MLRITPTYEYDTAGRLLLETLNRGGLNTEKYSYDSFGNLRSRQRNAAAAISIDVNPANNRTNGFEYDVAGNMNQLMIGTASDMVIYDAFNQVRARTQDGNTFYLYTADDERIGTREASGQMEWTIRDFNGSVLRRFESAAAPPYSGQDLVWMWNADYVYGGGQQMIASRRENDEGGVMHYHVDHLGTPRLMTNENAIAIAQHDYYGFGIEHTNYRQEMETFAHTAPEPKQFTGHEREYLTGTYAANPLALDYMHARFYNPQWGRFLSVDPGRDWDASKPQSWNMYAYVRNNSVVNTDPTGRSLWSTLTKGATYVLAYSSRGGRKGEKLVATIQPATKKDYMRQVNTAITDARKQGGHVAVVTPTSKVRDGVSRELSANGKFRGPEKHGSWPTHNNPETGSNKDVHVQTLSDTKKAGLGQGLLGLVAGTTMAAAASTDASASEIVSAAAWDVAKALDPLFVTDIIEHATGLNEYTEGRPEP